MANTKNPKPSTEDAMAAVSALIARAKRDGSIQATELTTELEKLDLPVEKIEHIYDTFDAMGIQIVSPELELDVSDDLGMDMDEVITLASMIEKETASAKESSTIASVIYNRLCDPANYPYLNIDATIVYALGGVDGALTYEDTQIDSPYNTYNRTGLPAGPISNPGLSSISAALHPADTSYYYYALAGSTGLHHFSESYDEHQAFLAGQNDA